MGARANKPLVQVFCAQGDEADLMSRLFGIEGEDQPAGAIAEARGGTLLLEDAEVLGPECQARLLALINAEDGAALRVVSICNSQELEKRCERTLRPDLFHRLSTLKLTLPPLRHRGDDILQLFNEFTNSFAEEYGCEPPKVTPSEAAQLMQAPWPGNVRQLMNVAERAVLQRRRGSGSITSLLIADNEAVPVTLTPEGRPLKDYVDSFERMLIDNTMRRHQGAVLKVMEELCLPRRTLNEKMAKYGLSRSDYL